jgi:hypothetical protein
MTDTRIANLAINTIRTLSIDAIQQASSGHPGTPMGMAPVMYCLWQHFLRFDPEDPIWPDRDRFVLSAGHASMLLYSPPPPLSPPPALPPPVLEKLILRGVHFDFDKYDIRPQDAAVLDEASDILKATRT